MKERNPLNFSQYFRTWLYTRLVFNQIHVNKLLQILSPCSGNMIVACVFFTFLTKFREVQVLGIRNLSQKMALKMIPIQKTGLHFFEFRVQGQRICKLFKLTRYFVFLLSSPNKAWPCCLSGLYLYHIAKVMTML